MKIVKLTSTLVSLPHRRAVVTPVERKAFAHKTVDCIVVQLQSESGEEGTGVVWTTGTAKAASIHVMVEALSQIVLGRDIHQAGAIHSAMWRHINPVGPAGIATIALSGIDLALWDLRGKELNASVSQLIGQHVDAIPAYASGVFLGGSIEEAREEARGYVDQGFRAIKMRVGSEDWRDDIARVTAVREEVGDDFGLMVDAAQAWETPEAVRMATRLEEFGLIWIEDPVFFNNVDGLATVAAAVTTPITAGEKLFSVNEFRSLIERRAVDLVMPDIQRVGGVAGWLQIATLASGWNLPVVPHALPEFSIQAAAAVPGVPWLEYLPFWEPLWANPLTLKDGEVSVPDGPGFGLKLNLEAVEKHKVAA
jgi:L-alanine-DL-glutamate epimerase-like enolase superfamily enzyme